LPARDRHRAQGGDLRLTVALMALVALAQMS
jgi:hypothetical protein